MQHIHKQTKNTLFVAKKSYIDRTLELEAAELHLKCTINKLIKVVVYGTQK